MKQKNSSGKCPTINAPQVKYVESLVEWINKSRYKSLDVRKLPGKLLQIDFSGMRQMKPYHLTPLACMIAEYLEKGYRVKLKNQNSLIKNYLSSFNFKDFCDNISYANNFPRPSNRDTFPLWRIEKEASNIYPKQVQAYFEENQLYGKDLFELGNSLGELMNNVFDHSECKIPGFTFTQLDSKRDEIITSVCDFGVTIPMKINRYLTKEGEEKLNAVDAIKKAIENEFSTRSQPRNRGFGLNTVVTSVNQLAGKILIVSGKAIYRILPDNTIETKEMQENFPGSLIVIYLKIEALRAKEEEMTDELQLI